jgi:hypothetical protein
MKKLIINEKNLPKLNKPADISMKFRIKNPSYAISGKIIYYLGKKEK